MGKRNQDQGDRYVEEPHELHDEDNPLGFGTVDPTGRIREELREKGYSEHHIDKGLEDAYDTARAEAEDEAVPQRSYFQQVLDARKREEDLALRLRGALAVFVENLEGATLVHPEKDLRPQLRAFLDLWLPPWEDPELTKVEALLSTVRGEAFADLVISPTQRDELAEILEDYLNALQGGRASIVPTDVASPAFSIERYMVGRIRASRIEASITQRDMAEVLGIARQSYSEVEAGKRRLNAGELVKVAAVLQMSLSDMLEASASEGLFVSIERLSEARRSLMSHRQNALSELGRLKGKLLGG